MKQTLIFLTILTICGSLSKAPVLTCGTKVKGSYYLKGKLVHVDIQSHYVETSNWATNTICNLHKGGKIEFHSDSTLVQVHKVYIKKEP